MRTLSLTKVNIIRRSLFVVIMLLAFMMLCIIGAGPSHAANSEGPYTLEGQYMSDEALEQYKELTNVTHYPDSSTSLSTSFKLYKVGSYVPNEPYPQWDSPYDSMGIEMPVTSDKSQVIQWTKDWLDCASTLRNKIPSGTEPDRTTVSDDSGKFTITGLANGLYLLVGDSKEITGYPATGQTSYWWPQPMLVSILNSDAELNIKPMYGIASHFTVRKVWQNIPADLTDIVKLDSITVEIYYEQELRYSEVLNDSNNWEFQWDPPETEGDPDKWTVKEVVDESQREEFYKNFTVTISDPRFVKDGDRAVVTITNKYDRRQLKIEKTLDAYLDNGEGNSTALVFELSGYAADPDNPGAASKRVYHKYVGMLFDGSNDTQILPVKDIPLGLVELKVKEVDSGNFIPDTAEKTAEFDDSDNTYKVSFSNKLDNHTHKSGVINKFKINNNAYKFDKSLGIGE